MIAFIGQTNLKETTLLDLIFDGLDVPKNQQLHRPKTKNYITERPKKRLFSAH